MFGENLELITKQCCVCKKMIVLRVDRDDLDNHVQYGVCVQHAFVDRMGRPYLTAFERELFVSECCSDCWHLLCPTDKLAYN